MSQTALQDLLFPTLDCFGCGPVNAEGLRLKSYVDGDTITATFRPWHQHGNGLGFLNGGIIATVLDCHSAAAVTWEARERGWEALAGEGSLPFVTAGIDVRYRRPTPLDADLRLTAAVTEASADQIVAEVVLWHEQKERAVGTATWRRWRPRPAHH